MSERKPALAENWQKWVFTGVFGTCALHLHNHYYPVSSNSWNPVTRLKCTHVRSTGTEGEELTSPKFTGLLELVVKALKQRQRAVALKEKSKFQAGSESDGQGRLVSRFLPTPLWTCTSLVEEHTNTPSYNNKYFPPPLKKLNSIITEKMLKKPYFDSGKLQFNIQTDLVCSGNNGARVVWSYPDRLHPRLWS